MRSWVTIDLGRVAANLRQIRDRSGKPILAVLKADAYGHGAGKIARMLQRVGCERLAVATTVEGLGLRDAGLRIPIHILTNVPLDDFKYAVAEDFIFTLSTLQEAHALQQAAKDVGSRETVHIELDTGMGRSGAKYDDALEIAKEIISSNSEELILEGAMTHFPSVEDPADPEGRSFALEQVAALEKFGAELATLLGKRPVLHAANSAGIAHLPNSYLNFVRPGGSLYGLSAGPKTADALGVLPALNWHASVVQVRDFQIGQTLGYGRTFVVERPMKIATVAVGYGDGYSCSYGEGGSVLIDGHRAPIVGRVSMDSITVDVSDIPLNISQGEEVVLLGPSGMDNISADELAQRGRISAYEVTCRISRRVRRFFKRD